MDPSLDSVVSEDSDSSICGIKYIEILCGDRCHLIQWPYTMHVSYDAESAR